VASTSRDPLNIKLSSSITVGQYQKLEKDQNRIAIIEFLRERFTERYVTPLRAVKPKNKHGFCTMAICCLMIEALESFWQGWTDTRKQGMSQSAFCYFFDRNDELRDFRGQAQQFYQNVRCGILHQAETTGGWRIRRYGVLFDRTTKTINASKFHSKLATCLEVYLDALGKASWDEKVWQNLRTKMAAICKNCRA
jgi:hypothetical protein